MFDDDDGFGWDDVIGNIIASIFVLAFFISIIVLFINYEAAKEQVKQDSIKKEMIIEDDFDVKNANYNVPPIIEEIKVK